MLFSVFIGIFFIIIIIILVDEVEIWNNILSLSFEILVIFVILYLSSLILRSIRYLLLVNGFDGEMKIQTSIGVTFSAYFLSTFLPARLGEGIKVIRPKKKNKVPYTSTGMAILFEKFLDMLCISLIVLLIIVTIFLTHSIRLEPETGLILLIFLFLEVFGFCLLIILSIWGDRILSIFNPWKRLKNYLTVIYTNYKTAIRKMYHKTHILSSSALITLCIWLIDAVCLYLVLFDLMKEFNAFLLLITVLSALFGYMTFFLPLSPGNIGSYEIAVSLMFIPLFAISPSLIVSAALIEHGLKTLVHLFVGTPSTFYYSEDISNLFTNNSGKSQTEE